ncbi:MAG: YdiU family protein [Saprospiraceae bacterium]|nr:YdiU family protein [Saprospiraceae bacterium]
MLKLESVFTSALPADPIEAQYPRQVFEAMFSYVKPKGFPNAEIKLLNTDLYKSWNIEKSVFTAQSFSDIMHGNLMAKGSMPYAMCYGGHQFGQWAGQLGDGRAINLGELALKSSYVTLQLKGAGPTPYARTADGFAVLRSSIREFLMSEAMHYLGIPTTRALTLSVTGESVLRDIMYNGDAAHEPGAIVCRTAPSFLRFGNYEIFAVRRDVVNLKKLADFTIDQFFGEFAGYSDKYLAWFKDVAEMTCDLIVHWQRVGFVHGVMNTDNMSILGLTIDYGPYGWMDDYDPNFTPNTTDLPHKRYRFSNQPMIAQWNLMALGKALMPLINDEQSIVSILNDFATHYEEKYHAMMSSKLGLEPSLVSKEFLQNLESLLEKDEMDMTMFYSQLLEIDSSTQQNEFIHILKDVSYNSGKMSDKCVNWLVEYQLLLKGSSLTSHQRRKLMQKVNPRYVLRNYMNQMAIEAAYQGDFGLVEEFFEMIKSPYTKNEKYEKWFAKRPDWAKEKIGSSMLSCSS